MLASALLLRLTDTLNDSDMVHWSEAELLRYLSDAQRQVVSERPDAHTEAESVLLVAGTRQVLPTGMMRLIDVPRNMGADGLTPGAPIQIIRREVLDTLVPTWHSGDTSTEVTYYAYDNRHPRYFYVYPPSAGGVYVECLGSTEPLELDASSASLDIPVLYANAVVSYAAYLAFSKDAISAINQQKAANAFASYERALGDKAEADILFSPNRNAPPEPGVK